MKVHPVSVQQILVSFIFLLLTTMPALAFVQTLAADSTKYRERRARLAGFPIAFVVDERLFREVLHNGDLNEAIAAAMSAWEDVPTASVFFSPFSIKSGVEPRVDRIFTISLSAEKRYFPNDEVANTAVSLNDNGTIIDADILLNANKLFSTVRATASYDLQAMLTHEIGHVLGLSHSAVLSAAMYAYTPPEDTSKRTLSTDDALGITMLYGATLLQNAKKATIVDRDHNYALVSGKITRGDTALFAAHVVAINQHGNVIAGALSNGYGRYNLWLPPGIYYFFVEPVRGPLSLRDIYPQAPPDGSVVADDFPVVFREQSGKPGTLQPSAAAPLTVQPGGRYVEIDMDIPGDSQNLVLSGLSIDALTWISPLRLPVRNRSTIVFRGKTFRDLVKLGLLGEQDVFISSFQSDPFRELATVGFVFDATLLGPKVIFAEGRSGLSTISGGIVLSDDLPQPVIESISRDTMQQGQSLKITVNGAHFHPKSTAHFSDGEPQIQSIEVSDDALTLTVLAPEKSSTGFKDLVVIGPDASLAALPQALFIDARPQISEIAPAQVFRGSIVTMTLRTLNFEVDSKDLKLNLGGSGVKIASIRKDLDDHNIIIAEVVISEDAALGQRTASLSSKGMSISSNETITIASKPELEVITPSEIAAGATIDIDIRGRHLELRSDELEVAFSAPLRMNRIVDVSTDYIRINVTAPENIAAQDIDLSLSSGTVRALCESCLKVTRNPSITAIEPQLIDHAGSSELLITATRSSFRDGLGELRFSDPRIQVTAVDVLSETELRVEVEIDGAFNATNLGLSILDDNRELRTDGILSVQSDPVIISVSPQKLSRAKTNTITIRATGANWQDNELQLNLGTGIVVKSVSILDENTLRVEAGVEPYTPLGFRDVIVQDTSAELRSSQAIEIIEAIEATNGCALVGTTSLRWYWSALALIWFCWLRYALRSNKNLSLS